MSRRSWAAIVVAVALLSVCSLAPAIAAETPIPPPPTQWVTDNAGVLSAATRAALNSRLAKYEHDTGHQVIVWVGTTTGDAPLEDWTIRAFSAWKVGRKGLDDGLALFIFMQDHKVRIEVGYGLESVVTDAIASRIARNEIAARMRAGDVDGAVTAGVSALLATIGGELGAQANSGTKYASDQGALDSLVAGFLVFLGLLIFFVIISRLRRAFSMYPIGSSYGPFAAGSFLGGLSSGGWSGGGGGGGFGGFSGGGGMGGGGGASASW